MNTNKLFTKRNPKYLLRHPDKYIGDVDNVIYRSTWEYNAFKFCDNNPNILSWCSEEIAIPYMKPVLVSSGKLIAKPARYFPDLYVEYKNRHGELLKELIEIKPKKQTRASRSKKYATNLYENIVYMVNMAKWDAAKAWCAPRNIKFCILTEDSLFR